MPGGSLKVLDSAGSEIAGAIDDQPLRVQLELDIDPASAPNEIEVEVVAPDGSTETITAERIDWGAKRPLYQTDLTTVDEVFAQFLEGLDPLLGHAPPKVNNGDFVRFEYDDLVHNVQTFDSGIDARYWFTEAELADRIGAATTSGVNLTNALRELRNYPESDKRSQIEEQLEARIRSLWKYLALLDRAKKTLHNPKLYVEQRIQGAQYYMGRVDLRDALDIHEVLESAKEIAQGHILSGVAIITLGGYQMLVQATGAAQLRTLLTGENEMGQKVGWDGRVVAFLDLVADGALQGASMKFQLDHIVAPTRIPDVDTRPRYTGPKPEELAPEGAIVDPRSMGMTPEAIRAAFRAARMYNRYPAVRPTNVDALAHLEAGALPKMESLKSKTIGEIDTLLGMAPENRGLVGLFEPETGFFETALRSSGMSDADVAAQLDALRAGGRIEPPPGYAGTDLWNAAVNRYHQRAAEYHGATGKATFKLEAAGEIRIENGVIVDAATGKPFTGDHDLFDFIDANGASVSPEIYAGMLSYLEESAFRAQHGAHKWWDPQRSDFPPGEFGDAKYAVAREIYEGIIAKHQGQEILIIFPPVGPPIALYAGSAPGVYLGHVPGPWAPVAKGSSFMLPTDIRFLGMAGLVERGLQFDDSVTDWVDAESEFRSGLEAQQSSGSVEEFEAYADAAAARFEALDRHVGSDAAFDTDDFVTGSDSAVEPEPRASTEGEIEGAGAETGESSGVTEPAKNTVGLIAAAAAVAAVLFFGGFIWLSGGNGDDATSATAAAQGGDAGGGEPANPVEPDDVVSGGVGAADEAEEDDQPPATVPPAAVIETVTGTLEPVLLPDELFVHSVAGNVLTIEFPTTGGPFSGSAVLELLHDVPRDGCQFQSVHEWEFSGKFDPATLEFLGTFIEVNDATTGNCAPDQAHLIYEMEPSQGTFYAGLYHADGEIWGTGFSEFTAPVSQTLIDSVLNPPPPDDKPQVFLFGFPVPIQIGEPGPARFEVFVQNTGTVPWTATDLTDSAFGDLLGVGAGHIESGLAGSSNCADQDWALDPGDFELCNFYVAVDGPVPRDQVSTISVSVADAEGDTATAAMDTEVKLRAGGALLIVEKFSDPVEVGSRGGTVTFTVRLTNLSSDVVGIAALYDDIFGDLKSVGNPRVFRNTCPTMNTQIPPQQSVECTFLAVVLPAEGGAPHENTVSAIVASGGEPSASAGASAVVTFAE